MVKENQNDSTEEKIFEAASEIFAEKGFDGARMQDIADKAGINKALLHYYYRSKEKLFHVVFKFTAQKIFKNLLKVLSEDLPLEEKIKKFFEIHVAFLSRHPNFPIFLLSEISRNPNFIRSIFNFEDLNLIRDKITKEIQNELDSRSIRYIKPEELIVNCIALSVFPFAAKEIIKIMLNYTEDDYLKFIENRIKSTGEFVEKTLLRSPNE